MSELRELLAKIHDTYQSKRDKGTEFENLMIKYFSNEPKYKSLYQEVLFYSTWVEKYDIDDANKKDIGIDLVAITKDGQYHAIQCKYRQEDYTIHKSDINSFLALSGNQYFAERILVSTTNKFTDNAERTLQQQGKPVRFIGFSDLESSQIDWGAYLKENTIKPRAPKQLMKHQEDALEKVIQGFKSHDRGQLIMACGTGKTLTSLHIAEKIAGRGKRVLFLAPSLSLLNQTINEWTQNSTTPLNNYAVCSDAKVGKKQAKEDDSFTTYLNFTASTNIDQLYKALNNTEDTNNMTCIYATYHSIKIICQLQQQHLITIDLIICDEAHRTAGHDNKVQAQESSYFTLVHDNAKIQANKRLYMTATPKMYGSRVKENQGVILYSMDDETIYGPEFYHLTFAQAIEQDLLVDYKVILLAVDEQQISDRLNTLLSRDKALKVSDAGKIIGCWKALSGEDLREAEAKVAGGGYTTRSYAQGCCFLCNHKPQEQ